MEIAFWILGHPVRRTVDVAVDLNSDEEAFDRAVQKKLSEESEEDVSIDLNAMPEDHAALPLPDPIAFDADRKPLRESVQPPAAPKKTQRSRSAQRVLRKSTQTWEARQMKDFCPGAPRKRRCVKKFDL